MLKILSISLVAVGLASSAMAQTAAAPAMGTTSAMMADDMVTVVLITEGNKTSDGSVNIPSIYRPANAETMAKAQATLKENPALMANLEKKSIQLTNVVGVEKAANGGMVVYVK